MLLRLLSRFFRPASPEPLGARGERLAAESCRRRGARILARNGRAYSLVEFDWRRVSEAFLRVAEEARRAAADRLGAPLAAGQAGPGRTKVAP